MKNDWLANVLMLICVGCAVVATTTLVINYRHSRYDRIGSAAGPSVDTQRVDDWSSYAIGGHRIGSADAPVSVIEFTDFECPYCRRFALSTLPALRKLFPTEVAVIVQHWPLPIHHLAYPAARAVECASGQGRFDAFAALVFEKQDSLGIKTFHSFAADAQVPDADAFDKCVADTARVPAIERGIQMASALNGKGTPLFLVNGLALRSGADSAMLLGYVRAALKADSGRHRGGR